MKLVIAEKPSVGNAIARIIGANRRGDGFTEGGGYIVSWCLGHLVALASPEEYDKKYGKPWKLSNLPIIPQEFRWTVLESTAPQFEKLRQLMERPDGGVHKAVQTAVDKLHDGRGYP